MCRYQIIDLLQSVKDIVINEYKDKQSRQIMQEKFLKESLQRQQDLNQLLSVQNQQMMGGQELTPEQQDYNTMLNQYIIK